MRSIRYALLLSLLASPSFAQAPSVVTTPPNNYGATATAVTCGTSSTSFGVSGRNYLSVNVPIGAGTVWFAWGPGATATTAPPSQSYNGGTTIQWGGGTGACIVASGTQAITVLTK